MAKERLKSVFSFYCTATNSAKNKKSKVKLTANVNIDEVKYLADFWNQIIKVFFVKEHDVEKYESGKLKPKEYVFNLDGANPNTGAKGNDKYSIELSKPLVVDEQKELDDFLTQSVIIEIEKVQPSIDFKEKEKTDDLDDFQDVETPKDAGFEDDDD